MVRWLALCALLASASCADDTPIPAADADGGPDLSSDRPIDGADDPRGGDRTDASASDASSIPYRDAAPPDAGVMQTEPPLTIPDCSLGLSQGAAPTAVCCPSAIGFEDGSTSHFLPPPCCKLALAYPQVVMTPAACGRGALRLDVDFRSTTSLSMCGSVAEDPACSYRVGEVSRAVLTQLDLTGLTLSAAIYLEGPPLPAAPVHGQLFVLGRDGLIDGPWQVLERAGAWTNLALPIAADDLKSGADIRLLGMRVTFNGQAWAGRAYVDEITWR